MTLSLAREKLNYSQEQLASLSQQIRVGDLTPILQIYEEDIKNPLKSVVTGTLLRSLFVQVQKAKVTFICSEPSGAGILTDYFSRLTSTKHSLASISCWSRKSWHLDLWELHLHLQSFISLVDILNIFCPVVTAREGMVAKNEELAFGWQWGKSLDVLFLVSADS